MKSRTEQLMENIRQTGIFRQLIPMEAAVGWPIPLRKEGKTYITLPFYGFTPKAQGGGAVLKPPFATLTMEWTSQIPVEYISLSFRNPWPEGNWERGVGTFPHEAIASMSVGEYKQMRRELLSMYDELLEQLSQGSAPQAAWVESFSQLLSLLIEPGLEPYYRALAPRFFDRFVKRSAQSAL